MGVAYAHANGELEDRKLPLLYCQTRDLSLGSTNYADIALEQYRRDKKLYDKDLWQAYPHDAVAEVLLQGLIRVFPCK